MGIDDMIGKIISHYKILDILGEGGMGVVYKAEDMKLKRTVALKFISPQIFEDEEKRTRFFCEAQAAAALSHSNINTVYEIDEQEGNTFIAMEFIDGKTLKDKLTLSPLAVSETMDIAIQIAEGLQEAHQKGIVHRDIKSSNIMVTPKGQVKIMDFGLAKISEASKLTKTATIMGTVAYMSPEQASGETVDQRTDIWSLGVVLYEMVAGRLPFEAEYEQLVLYSILNKEPVPVSGVRSRIPLELERIIEKCLEKDPASRYQTAVDLRTDLKRLKRDLETGASPLAYQSGIYSRKKNIRKWIVPTSAIVFVLALFYLIPTTRRPIKRWMGIGGMPDVRGLVVLPFTVIGGSEQDQVFCDGLMETLTSKLTQLEHLQQALWVVPANEVRKHSVSSATEAKQTFGVNLVMTESVQHIKDKVQLTLNLVDAKTLRQLKTRDIKVSFQNISDLHDKAIELAAQMLELEIRPQTKYLLAAGRTAIPDASVLYIRARGYLQRYENKENLNIAIGLFEKAIEKDPSYALAYAGLGEAYWRKYKLTKNLQSVEKAQTYGKTAVQMDEDLAPVRITLGIIYRDTGNYEKAIGEFQKALEIEPENSDAFRELAVSFDKVRKLNEAELAYKKAIELKPDYWSGYSYLGVFYLQHGRYSEAEQMFLKVIELAPDNDRGYNLSGANYLLMGHKKEALAMFKKSFSVKPNPDASSNLGYLYFFDGRYEDSIVQFKKAIELGGEKHAIWGNLADAYRYIGDLSQADSSYRHAIVLAEGELNVNPKDAALYGSLARYHAFLREHKKAIDLISKALKYSPDRIEILQVSVEVYEAAKQREMAIAVLRQFIQAGGSLEEIQKNPDLADLRSDILYKQTVEKEMKN